MGASPEIPRATTNASEIFLTSTVHDGANARVQLGRVMFEVKGVAGLGPALRLPGIAEHGDG